MEDDRKSSRKIQFSTKALRCIIKEMKEGDISEYDGADTRAGLRASAFTPIYGR